MVVVVAVPTLGLATHEGPLALLIIPCATGLAVAGTALGRARPRRVGAAAISVAALLVFVAPEIWHAAKAGALIRQHSDTVIAQTVATDALRPRSALMWETDLTTGWERGARYETEWASGSEELGTGNCTLSATVSGLPSAIWPNWSVTDSTLRYTPSTPLQIESEDQARAWLMEFGLLHGDHSLTQTPDGWRRSWNESPGSRLSVDVAQTGAFEFRRARGS